MFLSALGMLVLVGWNAGLIAGVGATNLTTVLWMLIATIPFILLREFGRRVAYAHLHVRGALAMNAVAAVLQIAGLVCLAAVAALSAVAACAVIGLACGTAGLGWLAWSRAQFSVRWAEASGHFRRNWAFGKWVFLSRVAGMLQSGGIILWVLEFTRGEAAAGVFAACLTIVFLSNPFVLAVGQLLTPKVAQALAHGETDGLCRSVRRWSVLLVVTMTGFCTLVFLFGGMLLRLLYGGQYGGSEPVIWVLAVNTLVMAAGMPLSSGLWALQKPDADFRPTLLALVVTLATVLALLPAWDLMGVACGLLVGRIVGLAVRWAIFTRLVRVAKEQER